MDRPTRRPRAIAIARPQAARDLAADWRRWSPAERTAAMLIAALAVASCLAQTILAAG